MASSLYTPFRREVLGKIVFGAAIASRFFFGQFSLELKLIGILFMITLGLLGDFTCPKQRPGTGEGGF